MHALRHQSHSDILTTTLTAMAIYLIPRLLPPFMVESSYHDRGDLLPAHGMFSILLLDYGARSDVATITNSHDTRICANILSPALDRLTSMSVILRTLECVSCAIMCGLESGFTGSCFIVALLAGLGQFARRSGIDLLFLNLGMCATKEVLWLEWVLHQKLFSALWRWQLLTSEARPSLTMARPESASHCGWLVNRCQILDRP